MTGDSLIYSKQTGEPRVPVTVRIEWFPDGTIRPLMYWMPDNSCYQVTHLYESTPLAFLKERGEGLRFKVRAKIIEIPESYSDIKFIQHETYLYFEDRMFCGKNIIDSRYEHAGKEYIPVVMDIFPNADYEIIYFWVQEARYMVEKTIEIDARGSYGAGGVGVRHKVDARLVNADDDDDPDQNNSVRRPAALYFELNKWFVSKAKGG